MKRGDNAKYRKANQDENDGCDPQNQQFGEFFGDDSDEEDVLTEMSNIRGPQKR